VIALAGFVALIAHSLAQQAGPAQRAARHRMRLRSEVPLRFARHQIHVSLRGMQAPLLRAKLSVRGITAAQWGDFGYWLLPKAGVIILGVVVGVLATLLLS
jgi:hypothetical protein